MEQTEKNGKKSYWLLGYEIKRFPHYVDAHQHYDYVTMGKTFPTLAKAKEHIRRTLYSNYKKG